jgi:serpin B
MATALGMAYLGARGTTAQAMARVLRLPSTSGTAASNGAGAGSAAEQALEAGLQARTAALRGLGGPGVTLTATNQLWADPSLPTLRSFLNSLATSYAAGMYRAPLLTNPAQAAQEINQAISSATDGQIPRLLEPGLLQDIGWVLTSALYMHAAWATPFLAAETSPGQFTTANGQNVTANFMHGSNLRAGNAGGWTGVSLPYRGGKLAMIALLPDSPTAGCSVPGAAALHTITTEGGAATIALPKVSLKSSGSMNALLKGLGMGVAFSPAADFSALSRQACCIGFVQQAATLQVGEKGTVAAAATAVGIEPSSGLAITGKQVVFDRPYLLLVTSSGGEPLFVARVANPVAG